MTAAWSEWILTRLLDLRYMFEFVFPVMCMSLWPEPEINSVLDLGLANWQDWEWTLCFEHSEVHCRGTEPNWWANGFMADDILEILSLGSRWGDLIHIDLGYHHRDLHNNAVGRLLSSRNIWEGCRSFLRGLSIILPWKLTAIIAARRNWAEDRFVRCKANFLGCQGETEIHRDDLGHDTDNICLLAKKWRPGFSS
jgi:hypothetical protein